MTIKKGVTYVFDSGTYYSIFIPKKTIVIKDSGTTEVNVRVLKCAYDGCVEHNPFDSAYSLANHHVKFIKVLDDNLI